eukprot:TRINITY_DN215_c0_g1_i1.p1 TRINITY_DN215_c0_g1~~TRINITY_DN215_c0_g1_i1.p1  ORF type:complete len:108 (+),score=6.53 TRINITY_DN215_c0_g1_i1:291-614(+)
MKRAGSGAGSEKYASYEPDTQKGNGNNVGQPGYATAYPNPAYQQQQQGGMPYVQQPHHYSGKSGHKGKCRCDDENCPARRERSGCIVYLLSCLACCYCCHALCCCGL